MKLVSLLLGLTPVLLLGGEDLQPVVEAALDQPVQLDLQDTPIGEAFARIAQETGVEVTIRPETLALLPYGANTQVTARMQNIPLREGLMHLTAPLGLRFEVAKRGIDILPSGALERIGRRATWEELDGLAWLASLDFSKDSAALGQLQQRLQFRLGEIDGWPPLESALKRIGAGPGDQVLTLACESLDWTWFPDGQHVVVLTRPDLFSRQLERTVSVRESHRKLVDVLQMIAKQAGVPVRLEPGVVASLLPQVRDNFSLFAENKTARDAFEAAAAATGLGYRVESDGVVFYYPGQGPAEQPRQEPAAASPRQNAFVGKISIPSADGVVIELLLRESDLSPETNRLRQKYLERADAVIKEALLKLESEDKP